MGKRVLVTGGAGFIGSHTVDALVQRGDTVRVYDNLTPQVHGPNAGRPAILHEDAEFIRGDVRDREGLRKALEGIEVVIHDAAEVGVGQSMYSIERYISSNVQGTAVLWDILVNEPNSVEKVFVSSSMSLYGEGWYFCPDHGKIACLPRPGDQLQAERWELECPHCRRPVDPLPTDEEKPPFCTSVYAQSKWDQEIYSLMIGKAYRIPTVAARYFNCYGPRQSLNNPYTGASAIFWSAIKNDKPPLIYEDGLQKRDLIHVHDLVRGKLILLDHPEADDQVFNLGTGQPSSILEVAETLIQLSGKSLTPNVLHQFRNGDIRHCYADNSRIRALGFEPRISLKEGLQDLVRWGGRQASVCRVDDAHQELVAKGLVV